jgi:AcrR family transcriptional regulator
MHPNKFRPLTKCCQRITYICMTRQKKSENEKTWTHRADNRERLIAAGYTVLSEKGYEATTVKEVAHVADVSPGLFHYYFSSKDELLLAVLHEAGERYGRMMQELRTVLPSEHFLESAFSTLSERVTKEPGWYRLHYELYAMGLRNPKFQPMLGEMLGFIRQRFTFTFMGITGGDEKRAQALAAVVLACFDGLALQQLTQPDADLSGAYDMVLDLILSNKQQTS